MVALGAVLSRSGGTGRVSEKWDPVCGGEGWARPTVHSDLAGALGLAGAVLGYTLVQASVLWQCLLDGHGAQ